MPEASEGIMEWSGLVVMVEVMFIDKSGGYLSPMSRMSSAVGGKASGVVCRAWTFPSNRGSTSDFQLLSHAVVKQTKTHPVRPSASLTVSDDSQPCVTLYSMNYLMVLDQELLAPICDQGRAIVEN